MASTYSNLGIQLMGTGDQVGTWGITTNTNLGTIIDQAISGYTTQAFSNADVTLSLANGASSTVRNMYIECTGTLGSSGRTLIVPSNLTKLYFIYNNTSDGYPLWVGVSSGTGVQVPFGARVVLMFSNVLNQIVPAINSLPSSLVGGLNLATPSQSMTALVINAYTGLDGLKIINASNSGVNITGSSPNLLLVDSGSNNAYMQLHATNASGYLINCYYGVGSPGNLQFQMGSVTRMTLGNAGGLTINAPASGTALTVTSGSSLVSASFQAAAGGLGSYFVHYDTTNTIVRGYVGWGAALFSGAALTDFGIAAGSGGTLRFSANGGTNTHMTIYGDGSIIVGSPTGGAKGPGTINVSGALYVNGVAVTVP
jgi:hypothetical protein